MNDFSQSFISEALTMVESLHFIRADWFYAFIPLLLFLLVSYKKNRSNKNWDGTIDPQLQSFVLSKTVNKKRRYPLLLVFIAASLGITALAGPVYEKLPQPVYREQSSLVIILDLSQSMNAADIKPSRLSRAKLELLDLLQTRKGGQSALIVYAAQAFTVTPLTNDNATISNLVPALETQMMPAQGSNLSAALAHAFSLFSQSGIIQGDILVITDDIHPRELNAIKKVASQGHRLSIFGIGTEQGAPIPLMESSGGGFLLDSSGAIVVPKLQPSRLQRYALYGGGLYVSLQADGSETLALNNLFQSSNITRDTLEQALYADLWREEGHWLLLPLLFFAALWLRKGWLAVLLIFVLPLPVSLTGTAHADATQAAALIDRNHLWFSPNQKAMQAFNAGDKESAARQFTSPEWKASAYYRKGDYEAAIKAYEQALANTANSTGYYNKGNALARLGKYEDAIKAYDNALQLEPDHSDASHNREQVKQALQKQQNNQQQQAGKQQEGEQQDSTQQDGEQQDSAQQDSTQPGGEQQDKESQPGANQQQDADQQQAEDEQLKQRDAQAEAKKQQAEQEKYKQGQQGKNETIENKPETNNAEKQPLELDINPVEASITEDEKAIKQWLRRIPDDPGGLLRRKFYYQYKNNPNQSDNNEPW